MSANIIFNLVFILSVYCHHYFFIFFFFFNDTATTEIYTLSLHDALPIWEHFLNLSSLRNDERAEQTRSPWRGPARDRKSTRLNSSHSQISYAVFCLKKKKNIAYTSTHTQSALTCDNYLVRELIARPTILC